MSDRASLFRFPAQTGTNAILRPLLFYDFNVPQEPDTSFLCLPHGFLPTYPGDRVLFGVAGDLVLDGVVDSLDPRGLVKVFEETGE